MVDQNDYIEIQELLTIVFMCTFPPFINNHSNLKNDQILIFYILTFFINNNDNLPSKDSSLLCIFMCSIKCDNSCQNFINLIDSINYIK